MKSACESENIDKVVIATDSEKIKETVLGFGFNKVEVYDRNPENAQDTSSTESVMLEYINYAELKDDDTFVLIQATSPLLQAGHIDGMFEKLRVCGADSIFSGVREKQFHWIETENGVKPVNYDPQNRPRRQDFQGLIAENGACYINSVRNIKRDNCRLSGKIEVYELPPETAYEIDEKHDWIIAENLLRNFYK